MSSPAANSELRTYRGRWSFPWVIACGYIALELGASAFGPYGWFIDELYYRACAQRLSWGFVDHPPLSIAVLAASRALLGDAFLGMRLWPALAVAGAALTSSALTRRLGGGPFACSLAAGSVLSGPVALVMGSFFSMNAFELLLWPLCALAFCEAIERGGRSWLVLGALLGLSVMNKHTSAAFAAVLAVGCLLTPARGHFRTRWPWLGALLAAAIVAPNLAWQAAHGWPSLEFYEHAQRLKSIDTPAAKVLLSQVLVTGPIGALIALLGVISIRFVTGLGPAWFALGAGFVALLAVLMLSHSSRLDRLVAYYPIVLASGAAALERAARARWSWLRPLCLALVAASTLVFLPVALPLLEPLRVAAYAGALGIVPQIEKNHSSALPQWLADRRHWPELVADVAAAYQSLSPEEQRRARLFAPSYGEAGALELWGPARGLPPVLSNHNSYYLWGLAELGSQSDASSAGASLWVCVGMPREVLGRVFGRVDVIGASRCEDCVDWRRSRPIAVARFPRAPLAQLWPELRHFE